MKKFWLVLIVLLITANVGFTADEGSSFGSGALIRVIVSLEASDPVFYLSQGDILGSASGAESRVNVDITQSDLSLTFYVKLGASGSLTNSSAIRADASKTYHLTVTAHSLTTLDGRGTADPTLNREEEKGFVSDVKYETYGKKLEASLNEERTLDNKVCINVNFNGETILTGKEKIDLAHWDFIWAKNEELLAAVYTGDVTLTVSTE